MELTHHRHQYRTAGPEAAEGKTSTQTWSGLVPGLSRAYGPHDVTRSPVWGLIQSPVTSDHNQPVMPHSEGLGGLEPANKS